MTTIACFGTGFERGCAHGEGARDKVRTALARWEEATLASLPDAPGITQYSERFLAQTGLWDTAQHLCPDLADEVRAGRCSAARGVPFLSMSDGVDILDTRAMRPSVALGRSSASPAVLVRRKSTGGV